MTKDVEGYVIKFTKDKNKTLKEEIGLDKAIGFEYQKLKPYTNYTVDIAMLYIEDEVGEYYFNRQIETLQDGKFHLLNPLSAKFKKWSNTLKQFVGKLPTNCLSVFDHFVGLALKGLNEPFIIFPISNYRWIKVVETFSRKSLFAHKSLNQNFQYLRKLQRKLPGVIKTHLWWS